MIRARLRAPLAAFAALALASGFAACGSDDVGGGNTGDVQVAEAGPVQGELFISNWPAYVDPGPNGTVPEFEKDTGVSVKYVEDINSNLQFFGKIRPLLEQGGAGGRDAIVVTDWLTKQMYDLGYLQELDPEAIKPALDNLSPQFEFEGAYDPDHKFSIPWQGGMTGIWVDTSTDANEITSVNQLFDPKYKGKVTMLDELRDSVPLVMRGMGVNMADATTEDWLAAIDKIGAAVDSGQIRAITGNDYTEDLTSGNVVASIGWSGDASLIGNPNAEWRRPTEGCNLWFDEVAIPIGAPNPAAAIAFINYVYRPEVQADIAQYVNYVTPVEGVKEILEKRDPALANNQLIFPSDEFVKDCFPFQDPPGSAEEQAEVNEAWQEVISG